MVETDVNDMVLISGTRPEPARANEFHARATPGGSLPDHHHRRHPPRLIQSNLSFRVVYGVRGLWIVFLFTHHSLNDVAYIWVTK